MQLSVLKNIALRRGLGEAMQVALGTRDPDQVDYMVNLATAHESGVAMMPLRFMRPLKPRPGRWWKHWDKKNQKKD